MSHRIARLIAGRPYAALAAAPIVLFAMAVLFALAAPAETCTTQSAMAKADRDRLASSALTLAASIQDKDAAALRAASTAEIAKDFGSLQYLVAITAPKLAGSALAVEQIYLLDASGLKPNPDGSAPEAAFYCSLNRSTAEAQFDIRSLPPGKYAFAMVTVTPATGAATLPWRLSFLLRDTPASQGASTWQLAGFYPKPLTAAGHDGLWYWTAARQFVAAKQPWNAWLYYQTAQRLLQPADFVMSTHLDKLRSESAAAAPSPLSDGVSIDAPLVVKSAAGVEYHFTALGVDESPTPAALDITAHLHVDAAPATSAQPDSAAARARNLAAAAALLAAYPELRKPFHGVFLYADTPGQAPVATEFSLSEIQ
jgi:hypothetical protein